MRSGSGSADSIRLIILRFTALVHSISRVVYTFFAAFWKRLRDPRERVFISSPSSEIAKRVSQLRTSGVPSTPVNRDPEAEVLPLYSHSISSCRYLQEKRLLYFPLLSAPLFKSPTATPSSAAPGANFAPRRVAASSLFSSSASITAASEVDEAVEIESAGFGDVEVDGVHDTYERRHRQEGTETDAGRGIQLGVHCMWEYTHILKTNDRR